MERDAERRNFYRINDTIGLKYSVLQENVNGSPASSAGLDLPLTTLFAEIDREFTQLSNTLWHENTTLAQALGLLNKKISIVAAHSLSGEGQGVDSYEEMMVNISGCGLAFSCKENLQAGVRLQLSVILHPSNTSLDFQAQVVDCKKIHESNSYWVRVNISDNNEMAQEQLVQHVVQKQGAQIEAAKLESSTE